jgi:tetratricopeptide (TPR) repeat protein
MSLPSDLGALLAADIVRGVPGVSEDEYEFRHALIQEAAYHEILKEDRASLHRAVGEALERLHSANLDQVAPELAFHFRRAGDKDKAVLYLVRAAHLAAEGFANDEALADLEEVLELVEEDDPGIGHVHEQIGDICLLTGRQDEALDRFRLAAGLATSALDEARRERKCGSCFPMGPDFDGPLGHLQKAIDLLGSEPFGAEAAWWHEWIQIRIERGFVLYFASGLPELRSQLADLLEKIKEPLARWGTPQQSAQYYIDCAGPYRFRLDGMGPSDVMLEIALDGVAAADASGDVRLVGRSRFILGMCRLTRSELDEAVQALTEGARISDSIGDAEWSCRSLTYLAIASRRLGDLQGVRDALDGADPLVERPGFGLYRGASIANRAWLSWRSGDSVEAARSFDEAEKVWAEHNVPYPFAWIAAMPAISIALDGDDLDTAVRHAVHLVGLPFGRALPEEVMALLRSGIEAAGGGRADEARRALELSVERAADEGYL